jgi:hypothetical protein
MSLWGIHANKTASGTVEITSSGDVTGTGTAFTTQAKVGNYITVGQVDYLIRSIASDTSATVINGTVKGIDYGTSGAVTAVGSTTAYKLSEKPKYVTTAESNIPSGVSGDSTKVVGISAGSVARLTHAGWVREIVGSGGRSGRTTHEVLVVTKNIVN